MRNRTKSYELFGVGQEGGQETELDRNTPKKESLKYFFQIVSKHDFKYLF